MEIKILVAKNKKADLANFIEVCKQHGFIVTREGGGRLPNFSGYYAELKGERWQNANTGKRQLTIPDVSDTVCDCGLTHETCDCIDTGICEKCNKPISQTGR